RRFERTIVVEVLLEPAIARTGNVPGYRIDRLILTGEAVGGARIDQVHRVGADTGAHVFRVDDQTGTHARLNGAFTPRFGRRGADGISALHPFRVAAIENRNRIVSD